VQSKLVWRTEAGHRAWKCPDSGLPTAYRRILDLVESPTPVAKVALQLTDYPAKEIQGWLDELETLCFIHASRADESADYRRAA
jgi:hypothetical protein